MCVRCMYQTNAYCFMPVCVLWLYVYVLWLYVLYVLWLYVLYVLWLHVLWLCTVMYVLWLCSVMYVLYVLWCMYCTYCDYVLWCMYCMYCDVCTVCTFAIHCTTPLTFHNYLPLPFTGGVLIENLVKNSLPFNEHKYFMVACTRCRPRSLSEPYKSNP